MARIAKKVSLSDVEKSELTSIIKKGTHKSRKITRARALLLLDSDKSRAEIYSNKRGLQILGNGFDNLEISINQRFEVMFIFFNVGKKTSNSMLKYGEIGRIIRLNYHLF